MKNRHHARCIYTGANYMSDYSGTSVTAGYIICFKHCFIHDNPFYGTVFKGTTGYVKFSDAAAPYDTVPAVAEYQFDEKYSSLWKCR